MRPIALTLAASLLATPALADGFHDLAAIDNAVAAFTGAAIGQPGGAQAPVSRQLRLAPCRQPLRLEWQGAERLSLRVACPDPDSWRLFVPLMQGAGQAQAAALVSRRDVLRVEAVGPGFRIARTGEALEDGRAGSLIRVRVDDGTRQGRVISAEVVEAGKVRVPLG